ncbi:hypothetical protein J4437_06810 [Candidatus Woesearchaeota archaeon]|nr:hypothetical protein [Candidatus Woesearchaeota archaeon]
MKLKPTIIFLLSMLLLSLVVYAAEESAKDTDAAGDTEDAEDSIDITEQTTTDISDTAEQTTDNSAQTTANSEQTVSSELTEDYLQTVIQNVAAEVQGQALPPPLERFFGNERINVRVTQTSGDIFTIAVVTKDGTVENIALAEAKDQTLEVFTTSETLAQILNSQNQMHTLAQNWKDKKITYKARGFANKIKFMVLSLVIRQAASKAAENSDLAPTQIVAKDKIIPEKKKDEVKEEVAVEQPVEAPVESGPETHDVLLIETGFEMTKLEIKVGDTVTWKNVRTEKPLKGMILGSLACAKIRSPIFMPGESFSWTFNKKETCMIVDGIYTTQTMKVVVE